MPVASRRRTGLQQIPMLWPRSREMKPWCLGGPVLGPVFYKARNKSVTVTDMWRNTVAPAVFYTAAWLYAVHDVTWQLTARSIPVRGCVCCNFVILFYVWYFALTAHSFLLLLSRPISKTQRNENKCHSFSGTSKSKYHVFFYVLLTMHPVMILVNNQLDAQYFMYFISILYMFRAVMCPIIRRIIVSMRHLVYATLCRWHKPRVACIGVILLMMGTWLPETCMKNCASSWLITTIKCYIWAVDNVSCFVMRAA